MESKSSTYPMITDHMSGSLYENNTTVVSGFLTSTQLFYNTTGDTLIQVYPQPALAIIFTIVALSLGLLGVTFGSVVLLVMLFTKRTRKMSSAFLINLVCSDLLVSAIVFPAIVFDMMSVIQGRPKFVPKGVPCQLLGFLLSVFTYNSVLSLSAIALDRYQAIVNCLEYTSSTTYKRVIRGLLFCWIQSIGWSLAPLLGWGSIYYMDSRFMCVVDPMESKSYTITLFLTQFMMPLTIMSVCYIKIVKIARRHARRICDTTMHLQNRGHASLGINTNQNIDPAGILAFALVDPVKRLSLFPEFIANQNVNIGVNNRCGSNMGNVVLNNVDVDYHSSGSNISNFGSSLHKEARATIKLLGLILVFIFTWIQLHIVNLLSLTNDVNKTWGSFSYLLACSNSCCNPIMYVLASRRFRHNLRKRWNTFCSFVNHRKKKADTKTNRQEKLAMQIASLYTNPKQSHANHQQPQSSSDHSIEASVIVHHVPPGPSCHPLDVQLSPKCVRQESPTSAISQSTKQSRKPRRKKHLKGIDFSKSPVKNELYRENTPSNSNVSLQRTTPLPPIGMTI